MHSSSFHFLPPLFLFLAILFGLVVAILQIGILGYAYERMGISRVAAYAILFFSLMGSYVNIPVAEIKPRAEIGTQEVVDRWGFHYVVPVVQEWPGTMLAVNVGGAVIPTLLSIYLVVKNRILVPASIGIVVVGAVVHMLAEPVQGVGIAVPVFIPPILSAVVAMVLSRDYAGPLAYVSGCMGTLLGADLLNLSALESLGASIASIGGAGTFDGVFLTGILAVLLAGTPRTARPAAPSAATPPSPAQSAWDTTH